MKKIIAIVVSILILGCQNSDTLDGDSSLLSVSKQLNKNHLACRSDETEGSEYILNEILAQPKLKGVVLYFHGGLSGQNYMENELGRMLKKSIFSQDVMKDYYPVFMNYDASPLVWESVEKQIETLTEDAAFKRAAKKFYKKIQYESNKLKDNKSIPIDEDGSAESSLSQFYIDSVMTSMNKDAEFILKSNEEKQEEYFNILENDGFAEGLEREIVSRFSDFSDIQKDLQDVNGNQEKGAEKAFLFSPTTKIIIRALARFATNTHHEIVPTFEEEAFKAYKLGPVSIQKYAANHWKMVKEHSEECFAKGTAGRNLVDELISKRIPIHTISHSAGSIPTGYLLSYLSDKKHRISSANLIVPAINQTDFSKLFIENKGSAEKITGYVLRKKEEKEDSIAFGLYPASLLYFVSGSADDSWYNDRMLMIDQHLRDRRAVYASKIYQRVTGENPEKVWSFFESERNNWFFYPSKELEYEVEEYGNRASHECTKYPWISTEIAKSIIFNITGIRVDNVPMPISENKNLKNAIEKANKKCL